MEALHTLTREAKAELHARAAHLKEDREKVAKAMQLLEEGRIDRVLGKDGHFEVIGLSSGSIYTTSTKACTCKARKTPDTPYACYHALGIALYQWVADTMAKQGRALYADEDTPQVAQDAQEATQSGATGLPEAPTEPMAPGREACRVVGMPLVPLRLELPRRSISAIIADLSRPLPEACLGTKPKGGATIRFLHWPTVVRVLDTYAPGWQGSVVRTDKIGDKIAVTYRLTIQALEGDFSQEDAGMEDEDKEDYGDAMTNALAAALKRAAAKFGVGRWLYEKADVAKALSQHLNTELRAEWAELAGIADAAGLNRDEIVEALQDYTGAPSKGQVPLWALRAMVTQLRTHHLLHA